MKLKFLRIAALTSAVMILGSCVEEDVVGKDFARQQRISAEISDYDDDDQVSRSCVDVINTNNSVTCFLWQPGDKIGVYTKDGNEGNVLFTNPAKHNGIILITPIHSGIRTTNKGIHQPLIFPMN